MRRKLPCRTADSSSDSPSTCALTMTLPLAACSPVVRTRSAGSTSGSAPPRRSKRHGTARPRTVSRHTSDPSSSHSGPSGCSVRVRWLPTQTPAGRSSPALSERAWPLSASMTQISGWVASGGSTTSVPNAAIQRPSEDQAGAVRSPRRRASSRMGPPAAGTRYRAVCGFTAESGPRSATNAMDRPSGDQLGDSTSKSPLVSWRGRAPRRAATSHRWARLSR